jgi:putative membrane protein
MDNSEITRTDLLALERTKLANERTFLAYFRTFVVFLSSGFAILKLEILNNLMEMGYLFIALSLLVVIIGVTRFFRVKSRLNKYYK